MLIKCDLHEFLKLFMIINVDGIHLRFSMIVGVCFRYSDIFMCMCVYILVLINKYGNSFKICMQKICIQYEWIYGVNINEYMYMNMKTIYLIKGLFKIIRELMSCFVGKGTCCQFCQHEWILETHKVSWNNRLPQVYLDPASKTTTGLNAIKKIFWRRDWHLKVLLWLSHTYHGTCSPVYQHISKLVFKNKNLNSSPYFYQVDTHVLNLSIFARIQLFYVFICKLISGMWYCYRKASTIT